MRAVVKAYGMEAAEAYKGLSPAGCPGCGTALKGREARCARCASPEGWLALWEAHAPRREPADRHANVIGRCWVPEVAPGVSRRDGYTAVRVVWPGETQRTAGPEAAHRVAYAAAFLGGHRLLSEVDGASLHIHHACRTRACVRPSHLELTDGMDNGAEMVSRASLAAERDRALEQLAEAEVALADLQERNATQRDTIQELEADMSTAYKLGAQAERRRQLSARQVQLESTARAAERRRAQAEERMT